MKLKLLSWNIWWDGDFEKIAEFLRAADADVISLQEVSSDDPGRDVMGYLKGLGYYCAFYPVLKTKDCRTVGNAVFSKYQIAASKAHMLSSENSRLAVQADVRLGKEILRVFSVHLVHTHIVNGRLAPSELHALQGENLLKILPRERAIVMGDFNATPENPLVQRMRAVMADANPDAFPTMHARFFDCTKCTPQDVENITFDYIFTTKDIKTSSFAVGDSNGSDHLPISVAVEIGE